MPTVIDRGVDYSAIVHEERVIAETGTEEVIEQRKDTSDEAMRAVDLDAARAWMAGS